MLQRRVMNEQKKVVFSFHFQIRGFIEKEKTCFINKASDKFKYIHLSVKAGQLKLLI